MKRWSKSVQDHMAKHSGLSGVGSSPRNWRPEWHRTPWWAFWRPAWRREKPGIFFGTTPEWEYQTHKQRAREFLKENFSDEEQLTRNVWAAKTPHYTTMGLGGKKAKI
jgi:hypothetical protein